MLRCRRWMHAVLAVLVCGSGTVLAAPWQGEVVERDGVPHVLNPEQPVQQERVRLVEAWRVGGDDEDVLFGVLSQLVVDDDGLLYLLDGQLSEIQVFSPSGEWLRTIGREGEGPGEFRNASDLFLAPGGVLAVLQVFPGRIVLLQRDGTPAGTFPLPEVEGGGFQLVFRGRATADRVILAGANTRREGDGQVQVTWLDAFAPDGTRLVRFHDEEQETQFGGMRFQEKRFVNFQRRWDVAADGRVAAALDFDAYTIHLWNADGSLERVVERPAYRPLPRTPEQRARFQKLFEGFTRWNPGSTFETSETHQTVNQVMFQDDGSLWVLSSRGMWATPEGVLATYDVYDRDGRFVRQVSLEGPGDPMEDGIFVLGERVYVVTDLLSALMAQIGGDAAAGDEEDVEPVTVIAYRMEPTVAAQH